MTKAVIKSDIAADPDAIWDYLKDFSSVGQWNPLVQSVEIDGNGVGSVRTLKVKGIGEFIEQLEEINDSERVYTYSIKKCPLPVAKCKIQMRVMDNGDGNSTVEWSSEFEPDNDQGLSAVRTFQQMHQDALNNLGQAMNFGKKS